MKGMRTMTKLQSLKDFLDRADRFALVEVAGTRGSTPRETGAAMLVSPTATHGTIGGGQLEFMAIDKARQLLFQLPVERPEAGRESATLDIPLGPEIGQCCGGRVAVSIRLGDPEIAAELVRRQQSEDERLPHLYIFGGGHVGHAMAAACALMPVHVVVVDTRADALEGLAEGVAARLTAMPEEAVRTAPSGSAFAVLTHDHALDFLIVSEALKRTDAAYVGMIGSKTKKATFRSWFLKTAGGTEAEFSRLVSPIGGEAVKDKRPPVIAALAAAEIMTALALHEVGASGETERAG
jgi:xanthine dehydrogenase accessory factor